MPNAQPSISEAEQDKKRIIDSILSCSAHRKIVIGGPGTGKTRLFQEICRRNIENNISNHLTLSYTNELVDDLATELRDLSEVGTFHSFALTQLRGSKNMYLGLTSVIKKDLEMVLDMSVDFAKEFHNLTGTAADLDFYSQRRKYYDHYGPDCSVFALLKQYEATPSQIPSYSQIMIDEFQDFNILECKIIDALATNSPILFAGDDDQALYAFKHSRPDEIRQRYNDFVCAAFELPYCSRCVEVVVRCFNSVVTKAFSEGHLQSRINKRYIYMPSNAKNEASSKFPKIKVKLDINSTQIASNIHYTISRLIDPSSKQPKTILVICPLNYQVPEIVKKLLNFGYTNIVAPEMKEQDLLMDGLRILLKAGQSYSNLGWRVVTEALSERENWNDTFKSILISNHDEINRVGYGNAKPFYQYVEMTLRQNVRKALKLLRIVLKEDVLSSEDSEFLFTFLGISPTEIALHDIKVRFATENHGRNLFKNTKIKVTNILKSKGLTYDHVFLVNFDDRFLLEHGQVTDESLCKFLVALTRARESVNIYTTQSVLPTFVNWMPAECLEVVTR